MADLVRVESIDALRKFRAVLCKFAEIAAAGLDEAEFEVQRTGLWVKQDQQVHWKHQLAHRTELVTRAKLALNRKQSQKTALGGRYSCVDEMKALATAERALEEARQKQASVQRWSRVLDEEAFSFQGLTQGLRLAIQSDIPAALAQLDSMIVALEAYATSAPQQQQVSTAPGTPGETAAAVELPTMARTTPPASPAEVDAYHRLRARTPSQAIRDATPFSATGVGAELCSGDRPLRENADDVVVRPNERDETPADEQPDVPAILAVCGLPRTPCGASDKVVLARAVLHAQCVYLERAARPGQGDSGWYVGFADQTEAAAYDALRVADLLALRPRWTAVLELPAGFLVRFDGPALAAVYDACDKLVWRAR